MKIHNHILILCAAAALMLPAFSSCKDKAGNTSVTPQTAAAQHDINAIVTTIGNYTLDVSNATSVEEIAELDTEFANAISKYADSKEPVNEADLQTVLAACERLSITINGRVKDLSGEAPMTLEQIQQSKDQLATDLGKCKTVGQVVRIAIGSPE